MKKDRIIFDNTPGIPPGKFRVRQTNADRIRAMSDEELADTLAQDWCDTVCGDKNACSYCDGKCEQHICNWLRQEVKE